MCKRSMEETEESRLLDGDERGDIFIYIWRWEIVVYQWWAVESAFGK